MFRQKWKLGGKKIMIKGIITLVVLWIIIAFTWDPFVSTVEKTQAVDKTKELVYNVFNKAKEIEKNE